MSKSDDAVEIKSQECGIGSCKLQCCNKLADIRIFLVVMCFISSAQTAFSGYFSSLNTTIEKRFSIGSFMIGLMNATFEPGYIIGGITLNYFYKHLHIPRWISICLIVAAFGAFLWSFPHFIMPEKTFPMKQQNDDYSSNVASIIIIFVAQFCIGIGSSPILTLAPSFIDNHVHPSRSPPLIASLYAASALGPVLGFILGTGCLKIPEKLVYTESNISDPNWIGAWWLGYLFLGVMLAVGAFILFTFPKRLRRLDKKSSDENHNSSQPFRHDESLSIRPNTTVLDTNKETEANIQLLSDKHYALKDPQSNGVSSERHLFNSSNAETQSKKQKMRASLLSRIRNLICNRVFMVAAFAVVCEMFTVVGFALFLPKYLEVVYGILPTVGSPIVGGLIVPAGAVGIFIGGFLSRRFARNHNTLALILTVISGVNFICFVSFLFLGCPLTPLAGINSPYPHQLTADQVPYVVQSNSNYNLMSQCNKINECNKNDWEPLCNRRTGISFISSCFAGCNTNHTSGAICSCLMAPQLTREFLVSGMCPISCNRVYAFVGCLTALFFLTGLLQNPLIMITLRSVPRDEAALALAFEFSFVRIFAHIPAAIVYGKAMDNACELWHHSASKAGNCSYSNRETMMNNIVILAWSLKSAAFVCYVVLYILLRMESRRGGPLDCRGRRIRFSSSVALSQISVPAGSSPTTAEPQNAL